MSPGLSALLSEGVTLLDGAMGTALMSRGLPDGEPPECWNLRRPEVVREIHAAYIAAGSAVVQTNTFGANPHALARHGLAESLEEIVAAAAQVAREAAGTDALVAGNMGPSGRLLAPLGDATELALEDGFSRQASALAAGGVDYLSIETMMDLREAVCALRGARRATDLPVTVCLTFDQRPKGFFTMMGDRPADCARRLVAEGAVAVGANCSIGSGPMIELCALLVEATDVPVIVKPNAGLPEVEDGQAVYRQDPEEFAQDLTAAVEIGAGAVGGCCGTDERWIAALSEALKASANTP